MTLEATGHAGCIAHAKALRALPDDANMAEVEQACDDATDAAAVADADEAGHSVTYSIACATASHAADAAEAAIDAEYDEVAGDYSDAFDAADAAGFASWHVAKKEYVNLVAEARALAYAS